MDKDVLSIIDDYLSLGDWKVFENSNMGFSLQGLNNHIISKVVSQYWLNKIYPPEISRLHVEGYFHIHDLGMLSAYCMGWDLKDLLIRGFGGVFGKVESHPPKHFRTALGQLVNFMFTLQGEFAGAQAVSNFDTLLAPFVYYDNLSYKQVKQAMQEFIYNMNIPTRTGYQTPFTNLTMDLVISPVFKDEYVIVGGEVKNRKYGEFQEQADMINKAFCEVMIEGDAKHRIFSFPIPTYNISNDFNWDNPELKPLWEMTALMGIPYFANFINSDLDPTTIRSMCCRLRLDTNEIQKRTGGLFASSPMTGSIGVVTLNLPRIGYLARDKKEFFDMLDDLLVKAKESLEIKRRVVEKFMKEGLYPYSKVYLQPVKNRMGKYFANHFSTIGIVGANEMCLNFLGKDIASEEGLEFAKEVLVYIRNKTLEFQKETGNLYNLEATPAESTAYRLAKIDKNEFPDIITQGQAEPYYTNSSNLPVNYTDDLFWALDHQNQLQPIYTGGTVFHIFLGESIHDPDMAKELIRLVSYNYEIPYFTLTPTFTICSNHGLIPGAHFVCPYEKET